jgi:hypothetical protein
MPARERSSDARAIRLQVWPAWVYDERAALVVHALSTPRGGLARGLGVELPCRPPARAGISSRRCRCIPRERERGYNQAARLAEAVADAIGRRT